MLEKPTPSEDPPAAARYWLQDQPPDLNAPGGDAFAVSPLVDRLAKLVKASPAPFTLSLSGSWGIGKSTIAEALIKRVREQPNAMKACLVDAWSEDIEHLRRTLAIAVGAELRSGDEHREAVAAEIDEPVGLARAVTKSTADFALPETWREMVQRPQRLLAAVLAIEVMVLIALFLAANDAGKPFVPIVTGLLGATLTAAVLKTDLIFRFQNLTETKAPAAESVHMAREFAKAVSGENAESKERVLVVVDNLDRLPGADALRALAEIRSLVEIKGSRCVFLIPVDRTAFAGHIQSALSLDDLSAKDYLDKFFNLDVLLTQPEPLDVRDWATEQARPLFGEEVTDEELAAAVQTVASMAGGSPRAVKRIINGVSTRLRMLDESVSPPPTLAQLALIEGLIVRFPELVAWLESEPRNFSDLRATLADASRLEGHDKALADVPGLSPQRREALRTVLVRNGDIAMSPGLTRLVMALREDRAWKGIPEPQAIREALENGEPEAYSLALDAIDEDLRATAIARSVAWIDRSVPAFPRDAMTNLIAIADKIDTYPTAAEALRPTAVRVVLLADQANQNRTTEALARFVLDPAHPIARRAELAAAFGALVAPGEGEEVQDRTVTSGVLLALRLGSSDVPPKQLVAVRTQLSGYSDDDVSFAWEPEVDLNLVTGPVAAANAKRLTSHDMLEAVDPPTDRVISRMITFAEAGGTEPTLAELATALTTQLGASTATLTPEAVECLGRMSEVLATTTGTEIDALASALATSTRGVRGDLLIVALDLEVPAAIRATLAAAAEAWLAMPAVEVPEAKRLLDAHGPALMDDGINYVTALATQWVNRGVQGFAALALELIPETAPQALIGALAGGGAGDAYPIRVAEAADLIGTDGDGHLTALVAQAAVWVATSATEPTLTALAPALLALQGAGVDCSPIHDAFQNRLETQSLATADLLLMAQVVMAWESARVVIPAALSTTVTSRMVAVAVVDADAAQWAARKTKGSQPARLLMVEVIKDAAIPVQEAVAAADATYGAFRHHEDVGSALVARAAVTSDEGQARQLLEQAVRWNRPRADRTEFDANLTTIGTALPGVDDLVTELRKQ